MKAKGLRNGASGNGATDIPCQFPRKAQQQEAVTTPRPEGTCYTRGVNRGPKNTEERGPVPPGPREGFAVGATFEQVLEGWRFFLGRGSSLSRGTRVEVVCSGRARGSAGEHRNRLSEGCVDSS